MRATDAPWEEVAAAVAGGCVAVVAMGAHHAPAAAIFPPIAVASLIDWRTRLLPDRLTLPALAAALFSAAAWGAAADAAIGAAAGLALGVLLVILRPGGAGMGDAKLMGAIGAGLGLSGLALTIAAGSIAAFPAARREHREGVPMGPYFTMAAAGAVAAGALGAPLHLP